MILSDCFIHVYDSELNPMAMDLINATGAMINDSIIPFLTTHIVVKKLTPVLKQTLNLLHSKAIEGAPSNKDKSKLFGNFMNIHIVSLDWLKDSFLHEKRLSEIKYLPVEGRLNGTVHAEKNKRKTWSVTKNIFTGAIFAIRAESFTTLDDSGIEKMEKIII